MSDMDDAVLLDGASSDNNQTAAEANNSNGNSQHEAEDPVSPSNLAIALSYFSTGLRL